MASAILGNGPLVEITLAIKTQSTAMEKTTTVMDGLTKMPALLVTNTANSGVGSLSHQLTCLQNGDTIFLTPCWIPSFLTEPLVLDKQMWWWGKWSCQYENKMDMSLPVFATAQQGLWIGYQYR